MGPDFTQAKAQTSETGKQDAADVEESKEPFGRPSVVTDNKWTND